MKILALLAVILGIVIGIKKHNRTYQAKIKGKAEEIIIYDASLAKDTIELVDKPGDDIEGI